MLSRVVGPAITTYLHDYSEKPYQKAPTQNLTTQVTTGLCYCPTRKTLYQTSHVETADNTVYTHQIYFHPDLLELPPEYNSTVRPKLTPPTGRTDYQHYYGVCGEMATSKHTVFKARSLSKQTRANVDGTTRATHHPPKYDGHIPAEWNGNRGKKPHEERWREDILWQYHVQKTGYTGHVPRCDIRGNSNTADLIRAPTTYRDMCDELGYTESPSPSH
jgi:hypothetical protein